MFQTWRAKAKLLAPIWFGRSNTFVSTKLQFLELADVAETGEGKLKPYEQLAKYYHHCAVAKQADYASFLPFLAKRRGINLSTILDLACGAGTATVTFAEIGDTIVGLDNSEAMLAEAKQRCAAQNNIRFLKGDFRDFDLGQQFDAVVCATNSLNYVADLDELNQVFRCVAKHLQPGGVFAFDTATEKYMRIAAGVFIHIYARNERLVYRFEYDAARRVQEATVIMPQGVEAHRRIPLDPQDVIEAAKGSGLGVLDYFSTATFGRYVGAMCFFVLGK